MSSSSTQPENPAANPRAEWGRRAENWACDLLQQQGARILSRNFRKRCGELDIVALHQDIIVIVEVRLRRSRLFDGAAASINRQKQLKIRRTAQLWLLAHPEHSHRAVRFDVVAIEPSTGGRWRRQWLQQAFEA